MALPTPNPDELAALTTLKAVADAGVSAGPGKVAAIQSAIDAQQEVENFQKATFDAVNDDIIRRYEVERKWLDGQDIAAPILEADLQSFANDGSGRLENGGDFAPLRIPEFDGGPLAAIETEFENSFFTPQDTTLDLLQNGSPSPLLLDGGANIQASIDDTSTSLVVLDNTTPITVGSSLVVSGGGFTAIIQVDSVVTGGFCTPTATPDTEAQCTIEAGVWTVTETVNFTYLFKPGGTIPALSDIGQVIFSGFNNTERTNHVANDVALQPIMDGLLNDLKNIFNDRITALNNQLVELGANQDDNLDAGATTKANTSKLAIQGFLGITPIATIDISDTGITAINDEKAVRQPEITQRIIDIAAAIAFGESGTISYYDVRFNTSEGRCRLNNGSIVLLNDLEEAKAGVQAGAIEAQGLSDRYDALLP